MRASSWLAVGAAAFGLSACSASEAQETGPATSRNYPVAAFDKIEVAGPYQVTITTGGQPAVQARGGSNILDRTVVEVENGTLKIHPRKEKGMNWSWSSRRGEEVRFAVSVPHLVSAATAGSGNLSVGKVAGQRFSGSVAGSGELRLADVQVSDLALEIAGSGNVQGRGRATQAHYEIAGSGNIKAGGIAADRLQVEIAGSGNIEGQARSTADVDIAGSGNVTVTGGAKCNVSKAGIGNVSCS
ncbi:MAG: hypothetical protein AVDCRST_MAG62-1929 [uncultured Sphingomonas sp.]|jgi:hypothetical protein|uniref:Putative auto-transporter adhesin head GIN domain-containing protein n=1 Tax=uncultured Sphingomonas sp. TaxID=158754 RepID=A0A6J4TT72_9SPHN|nr:MAG: hypothetical protein AVDCRST_MAG62-1929 [uncultured Sphingomonas sp.]